MMTIDAPATPQPVTLTVTSAGSGKANVRVYFQNADSSLVSNAMTDANGVASAVMDAGGFVTAINPFAGADIDDVRTFAGVKPGDHLMLRDSLGAASTSVTFTADLDTDASVTGYIFQTKCGSSTVAANGSDTSAQVTLGLYDDCLTAVDTVVASLDLNNEVVHYFYVPQATVNNGAVDLTGNAYNGTPTTRTYTYSNLLASMGELNVMQQLSSAHGPVVTMYGVTTSGVATLKLPAFTGALDLVMAQAYVLYGTHMFIDWAASISNALTVDVGSRALTESVGFPSYDSTAHAYTWTPASGGQTPDFVVLDAHAFRETPVLSWHWKMAAPYAAGSVTLPVLPVETSGPDYNIGATDGTSLNSPMGLVLAKVPGGYDAVRAAILSTGSPTDLSSASAAGSITLEDISQTPQRLKKKVPRKVTTGASAWQSSRRM